MTQPSTTAQSDDGAAHCGGVPHRYLPRSLSVHSWRRFRRARRGEYFGQVAGAPSRWQLAAVESLCRREWLAIKAERADDADGALRDDREYQKLLADFRRSLVAVPPKAPSFRDYWGAAGKGNEAA